MFLVFAADSWEEAADAATPSPSHSAHSSSTPQTPDDEEEEADDSEMEEKKKKKKPVEIADDEPTKEPVNVIFIGHVGEWLEAFLVCVWVTS